MPEAPSVNPKETADKLRSEYHSHAVFQASCMAYEAIAAKDISRCLFWKEVLDILGAEEETMDRLLPKNLQ